MRTFIFFLCTLTALTLRAQQHTLESQIRQVTKSIRAQVGVAVIIDGKDTVTVNNDSRYPLMSVVKYPQSLAVAHFFYTSTIDHFLLKYSLRKKHCIPTLIVPCVMNILKEISISL